MWACIGVISTILKPQLYEAVNPLPQFSLPKLHKYFQSLCFFYLKAKQNKNVFKCFLTLLTQMLFL